jgi:hypothetical protein
MGYYIPGPPSDKGPFMMREYGAEPAMLLKYPPPPGKALIVVIDNGFFEAAGYAYNKAEYEAFTDPDDGRPKSFYYMDEAKARELSNFKVK